MKVTNEAKIGILVTAVLISLAVSTIKVGNFNIGQKGYELKVIFRNIDGVETSSPIRFNGLEVGLVKDIQVKYDKETRMELTLWLEDTVKIRQGAKASIKTMGLMGEKYIGIETGDKTAPFLKQGDMIITQEPVDFEKLLAKGDAIADNLKEISENINERLRVNSQAIDEIVVNINVASKNIASISENVNERLVVNRTAIDEIVTNLNTTSRNLEELSEDLKINPWKLLYKQKTKKKTARRSKKSEE